ncbi:mitochondrial ribonuclease P catalytic subunit [Chelmon rostratus]|uniref:mitochondrial ribonuclease P catalytic subunit n=1 Tax=Chelmon rostratus TaxID=109905 RepID=UPI001BEBF736|nr:mitochondrial ribonuclease P catalytic subunit [Chelmon rostratus]
MGSTLLLNVRTCQKTLKPFFHQGSSAFLTLKTSLCKSSQLPLSARFLCTTDSNSYPGGRQADRGNNRQGGVRNPTIRRREEDSLGNAVNSTVRQRPSFPRSVFAAGTAKRQATELQRRKAVFQDEEQLGKLPKARDAEGAEKLPPPDRPLSVAEWRELKESLGNQQRFDLQMMLVLYNTGAELDIAKSLLTFVAMETGTLSYELLLRYLMVCVSGGHDAEVFDVYDIMRGSFSSLETGASSLFIKSFSRTARWREALSILHELKKCITPSSRNYGDVIAAAMLHGDKTTAWALYGEIIGQRLSPRQETWDALFKGVRKTEEDQGKEAEVISESEHEEKLLEILLYMRNNQIYPQLSLVSSIKTWFESLPGQNWTGCFTSVTPKGVCRCCGSELESIQLTAEEYQQLKERVMTDIIEGQDVFKKTTPQELKRFKKFVKTKPPFDVVIDGLNIANISRNKKKLSETLLAVVLELKRRGLTILVLGRKHMLKSSTSWTKYDMDLIQQKAHCFFTENISEDDPFLLYATLHSGNHCQFASKDLMRDHKACLPDAATRQLFFKWQRGHQLVVDGDVSAHTRVRFQTISSYDTIVQTSADSWHLPYDDTEDRSSYEVPQRWLCLTKKQKHTCS